MGKALACPPSLFMQDWWARRKSAFAHPTIPEPGHVRRQRKCKTTRRRVRRRRPRAGLIALAALLFCAAVPIGSWMVWLKLQFGDVTGSTAKIAFLDWTRKPFVEWWQHRLFRNEANRHAGEIVAFPVLNPFLRSRGTAAGTLHDAVKGDVVHHDDPHDAPPSTLPRR